MELEQSKINKDGGSSYIQNKLIRKLAYFDMSSRESKIFHFIMGKTYCWNKDADDISLEQFVKGTGLAKTHVCDTLKILEKRQVIIRIKSDGYKADNFSINKNFDNWLTLIIKKKKFIPDIRNESFPVEGTEEEIRSQYKEQLFPKEGTIIPDIRNESFPVGGTTKDTIKDTTKEKEIYEQNSGYHDGSDLSFIQLADHWIKIFNLPKNTNIRDRTRQKLSKDALRQYGLLGCKEAINGCKLSEWSVTHNQIDLTHIFKDATTTETHMRRKVQEPIEKTKQSKLKNPFNAWDN